MSLHRRTKVTPTFNMSSMTDIIFLLLIFFMITSTLVSPNALKVNLPQSKKQTTMQGSAYVVIDSLSHIHASADGKEECETTLDSLATILQSAKTDSSELFVSLYADERVPYKNIVEVLSVANDNQFKIVLATRPPKGKEETSEEMSAYESPDNPDELK